MKRKLIFIICFLVLFYEANAQRKNAYGLYVIADTVAYQATINKDSNTILLNIAKEIPEIRLDIKYASKDNFLKEIIYKHPFAFARKPVVEALKKAQNELKKRGLSLKIYDAYRPYSITIYLYNKVKNDKYAANPKNGSRHNRGCAVDVTLVETESGKDILMPTQFDDFSVKAHADYKKLTKEVINYRTILIQTMEKFGFKVNQFEWWHFDYIGWEDYDIMDVQFEEL